MEQKKNLYLQGRKFLFDIVLYIAFILLMTVVIACKQNYHIDEMFSYGSSNYVGSMVMSVETGKTYEPANTTYMEYMTASPNDKFNQKEGLIPRSLLRNKLFQDVEEVIY